MIILMKSMALAITVATAVMANNADANSVKRVPITDPNHSALEKLTPSPASHSVYYFSYDCTYCAKVGAAFDLTVDAFNGQATIETKHIESTPYHLRLSSIYQYLMHIGDTDAHEAMFKFAFENTAKLQQDFGYFDKFFIDNGLSFDDYKEFADTIGYAEKLIELTKAASDDNTEKPMDIVPRIEVDGKYEINPFTAGSVHKMPEILRLTINHSFTEQILAK